MKLILEKSNNNIYAYFENIEHFTKINRENLKKISKEALLEECNLKFLPDNSYLVLDLHPLYNFKKNTYSEK